MGTVARILKELAVELNVPVLAAAWLKRGMFRRFDRTPRITDLHEYKSITPYADEVLLFDRFRHIELMDKTFINVVKNSNGIFQELEFQFNENPPRFEPLPERKN